MKSRAIPSHKNSYVEDGENDNLVVNYEDSKNSYLVYQNGKIEENGGADERPL